MRVVPDALIDSSQDGDRRHEAVGRPECSPRREGGVIHHVRTTAKFGEIKLLDALQPVQKSYKFRLFD
jgi:hypothetical protein